MKKARGKRKFSYDRDAVERKFKPWYRVPVVATSKTNKLPDSSICPGVVERQLSETNYILSIPGQKEKNQISHANLLKHYYKRADFVNVLFCKERHSKATEGDLKIIYPNADPYIFGFEEIIREKELKY